MILYFTGTGNSEYAAKKLAAALGEETTPLMERIRHGDTSPLESQTPWIVCTPTYAWQIPHIVRDHLRATLLRGSREVYFVMTCGSDIGNAEKHCKALCSKLGFELMGVGEVVMPENYVAMFYVPNDDEAKAIVKKALPVIDGFAELIAQGKPLPERRGGFADGLKSGIVNAAFYSMFVKADKFYATDACISCGRCAVNCLTHNIKLKNGKPVWGDNCVHCMKCICDCPEGAIEYGKASLGKPRYHCPDMGD